MTPPKVIVLPYVVAGIITPTEGDRVSKIVEDTLYGLKTAETPVSYLVQVVEQAIKQVKGTS